MTILFRPALRATAERLLTVCVLCMSLCTQVAPGVFEHVGDVCRECVRDGGRCAYGAEHGVHTFRPRGQEEPVVCTQPQAALCAWCHRVLDAAELPCPDHREPCCGCCEPR
jgi:hypothetical protein